MKLLYRIDADGNGQLQNDELDTNSVVKKALSRLGYVKTEFTLEIESETVDIVAYTPDTMTGSERLKLERLIQQKYQMMKQIKRIKL